MAKDVAQALGYEAPRNAIKKFVDDEDKQVHRISASGQAREVFIINEAGMYSLIFSSKLQTAKQFKRWVTHDVLPDIRKHGNPPPLWKKYRGVEAVKKFKTFFESQHTPPRETHMPLKFDFHVSIKLLLPCKKQTDIPIF